MVWLLFVLKIACTVSSDDTELTDDDVVIRYGENDEVSGLTILHSGDRPWRDSSH